MEQFQARRVVFIRLNRGHKFSSVQAVSVCPVVASASPTWLYSKSTSTCNSVLDRLHIVLYTRHYLKHAL